MLDRPARSRAVDQDPTRNLSREDRSAHPSVQAVGTAGLRRKVSPIPTKNGPGGGCSVSRHGTRSSSAGRPLINALKTLNSGEILAARNPPEGFDRIPGYPRRGRQDMTTRMGSSNSKRRESSSRRGVVRLSIGIAAIAALGAGAMAAVTLPFSVSASAMGASSGNSLVIKTEHVPKVGTVLATSSGRTLYRYTVDPVGKATCTGVCAKIWPPLLLPKGVTSIKAPHGVKGLSAIRIAGGRLQVFFHREALYVFASDTKKGHATGQGVEGTWFAVLSDDKSSAPTSATTTTTSPGAATSATVPPAAPPNTLPAPKSSNTPPTTATTTPKPSVTQPSPVTTPVTTPPAVTTPPQTTTTQPPTTTTTTSGYGY